VSLGVTERQASRADGHRGWKAQPVGGLIGLGTSPDKGALDLFGVMTSGIVSISSRV
jgi:hypothetical protein